MHNLAFRIGGIVTVGNMMVVAYHADSQWPCVGDGVHPSALEVGARVDLCAETAVCSRVSTDQFALPW